MASALHFCEQSTERLGPLLRVHTEPLVRHEGDATVELGLYADRTRPFAVGVNVLSANVTAPAWAYLVGWLGLALIGHDVFGPVLSALAPSILHYVATSFAPGFVEALTGSLRNQIAAPSLDNLVLTLDQVDVYESGLQLSGRADSGMVVAWDRTAVGLYATSSFRLRDRLGRPLGAGFTWTPNITTISITCSNRCAVVPDTPPDHFWAATYDDLPPNSGFGRSPFSLNAGDSALVWVETPDGPAKVLFTRAEAGLVPSIGMIVTWIGYRGRVHRSVDLVNHIKQTVVSEYSNPRLEARSFRYDGTVDLATTKFFLSNGTLAVGDEHRFFDNQPVMQGAGISGPGLNVDLDAPNRRLNIHVDQSGLVEAGQIQLTHVIRFQGIDVFGHNLEISLTIETPPVAVSVLPLGPSRPFVPIPIGDPFRARGLVDLLRAMASDNVSAAALDPTAIANLVGSLAPTPANGPVVLSRAQADTILSLLLGTGLGSQRGQIG